MKLHWLLHSVLGEDVRLAFAPFGKVTDVSRERRRVHWVSDKGSTTRLVTLRLNAGVKLDDVPHQCARTYANVTGRVSSEDSPELIMDEADAEEASKAASELATQESTLTPPQTDQPEMLPKVTAATGQLVVAPVDTTPVASMPRGATETPVDSSESGTEPSAEPMDVLSPATNSAAAKRTPDEAGCSAPQLDASDGDEPPTKAPGTLAEGSEWVPNERTRICSKHFVNGEKSTIASHPGYYPTIFPDAYRSCQADDIARCSITFSVFLCTTRGNEACTQVNHKIVRDAEVQCKPAVVSHQSGRDSRTACFTGYDSVQACAAAMKDLCGVSPDIYALLLSIMPRSAERTSDVPITDRLVLFLMKLKLGITYTSGYYSSLAVFFCVSRNTVSRHFKSVLKILSIATQKWIYRPPDHVIRQTMPNCLKLHYQDCSMIIDCTEVRTEQPYTVQQQRVLYSHYKGGYTLKFLVGITPCGAVCFCSKAYGGRCSDSFITVDSGFLDLVQPGDVVMADKGFPGIKAGLEEVRAVLVMPPFLQGQDQFSESEVHETYQIAQVRIHVERIIQRIKMFNILNTRIPTELIAVMSDVFHVCCVLANLQPAIISSEQ
ncbi:uncharacterized protein LOC144105074 [Amblyomma americanum]